MLLSLLSDVAWDLMKSAAINWLTAPRHAPPPARQAPVAAGSADAVHALSEILSLRRRILRARKEIP